MVCPRTPPRPNLCGADRHGVLTATAGVQFRWAAMQFLVATSSFPVALSYVRDSSELRTQLAQCALHPLIFGTDVPLPLSSPPREPGSEPPAPRPRPFPGDPRTPADLVRSLAHGAYHVLALVHAFSESRGEVQAQVYTAAAALLLEVQAADTAERAPTMVSLLRRPPQAAASLPQSPATKDAVETLRRAAQMHTRTVETLFGTPVLLVALESLVQVEVHTDIDTPAAMLKRRQEGAAAAEEEEARPRREADDSSRDGLPPLTVRDSAGGPARVADMPDEIVQWTMQRLERNSTQLADGSGTEVQMTPADLKELNALMQKYGMNEVSAAQEAQLPDEAAGGGGSFRFAFGRGKGDTAEGISSRGTLGAEGSGGGEGEKRGRKGSGAGAWGAPPMPVAQDAVRVAVAQGGLGSAREGMLAGAAPPPAVTLASASAQKADITVSMFPGDSGDILLSHFSFTIRAGAQQVRLPAVSKTVNALPCAGVQQALREQLRTGGLVHQRVADTKALWRKVWRMRGCIGSLL